MKKLRIIVGMSGGVDSSVAALLLKRQGHDVVGLFMKNWEESEEDGGVCTAEQDYADVRHVCETLGIDYYTVNFSKEYKARIFDHFLAEYARGRTPNPDVLCNREIKFGPFLDYAKAAGADFIATGHYAGVSRCDGGVRLLCAADEDKDQTYFLHQLSQTQLSSVLFPLERLTKREVRVIAAENGLSTAQKRDSTGICFIGERDFAAFLKNYLPARQGDIVTEDGAVVGKHDGLMFYTPGQRRGLGLGGVSGGGDGRWFVISKDLANNRLVVAHGDESALFSGGCLVSGINLICYSPKAGDKTELFVRLRHRQKLQAATVVFDGAGGAHVTFARAQRAVAPGQYCVFYSGGVCLGGGVID